jgi:hypothetical protein
MAASWMMRGVEYGNCNCNWGCPCQFNASTTHGHCEGMAAGHVEEGFYGDTRLDGLNWAMIFWWPGEIAEGNGRFQPIVDARADEAQRKGIERIITGQDAAPGSSHFQVFSTTITELLPTLYLPIDLEIDMDACTAKVQVPGVIESVGAPIPNPFTGGSHRAQIHLRDGFEYQIAEIGNGNTKTYGAIELDLKDSYGQWNVIHFNQDGMIR